MAGAHIYWLSADGDLDTLANYSGGAKPADGDYMHYENVTIPITAHLDQSAIKDVHTIIGRQAIAAIGTSGASLKYGTTAGTGTLTVDAPNCPAIYYDATTLAYAHIHNTRSGGAGLVLKAGTITECNIYGGIGTTLGAALDIVTLFVHAENNPNIQVLVEAGCDIDHLIQNGGIVNNYTDLADLAVNGGHFNHLAASALTMALMVVRGNGIIEWNSVGGTATLLYVDGGTFLRNALNAFPATITDGRILTGGMLDAGDRGLMLFTNPVKIRGGQCRGIPGDKQTVLAPPPMPF